MFWFYWLSVSNFIRLIFKDLNYKTGFLGSTSYRQFRFPVQYFLKYKKESDNYYQLKKLIEFFDQLQSNSFIKFFSDTQYRSLVIISEVQLEKSRRNSQIAKVWIAEELFYYNILFFSQIYYNENQ